jgi:hypothetical protein
VFYSIPLVATADSSVFYRVIAGNLPPGVQINETGVLSGNPQSPSTVQGVPLDVAENVTSKFTVRAYTQRTVGSVVLVDRLADRTFTLTITSAGPAEFVTPAGEIFQCWDGSIITDFQIDYTSPDPGITPIVTLVNGTLPAGLTVSATGLISGYTPALPPINGTPGYSAQGYDKSPFDFGSRSTNQNFEFTLKIANNPTDAGAVRTFSIYVYNRAIMSADTTQVTADNTFVTADTSNIYTPVLLTPEGSIGIYNNDNWFAYKFDGIDPSGEDDVQYIVSESSPMPLSTLGLELDINSGWLYGYIPSIGITQRVYDFSIRVYKKFDPEYISLPYNYSIGITGPISGEITWLTQDDLGLIDNGATSTLYVQAVSRSGLSLQYQLVSGSDSSLPQGLELLSSGNIAGRVSFNTFCLDGGTTVFDADLRTVDQPTTFDLTHTFTVNAYSINGVVSVDKTFTIRVVRRYQEPYDNLYIQAMPPEDDRALLSSLLQNPTIFTPSLIYRSDDPNFGVAKRVIYQHAYGLTAATLDEYVASLNLNHYWKNLTLGQIKTARALDPAGNVIYEVVYSEVVDNLINNDGASVGKQVVLPFPIQVDGDTVDVVYPNSLPDMRDQVIDVVGQVSNVLPRWMLSRQANGQVLGFTNAWVIAYTNPGQSGQIAYNIQQQFGNQLNLVDFKVDRYELDNFLTKNWDRENQHWGYVEDSITPYPPSLTTFDFVGLPPFQAFRTTLIGAGVSAVNQTYAQIGPYKYAGTTNSEWIMTSINFGNTWNIEHSSNSTIYYTSSNLISWSAVAGASPAPTASFYRVGDVVIYQTVETTAPGPTVYKDGAYRVTKLYKCIQNSIPGILPTNTNYWSTDGTNLASWINDYLELTTWEDEFNTLANWTYATPPGTTFDGGSMQFAAPVDMYSNDNSTTTNTTEYNKYLVFPKQNILE